MTHTIAKLPVTKAVFEEVKALLIEAGYGHAVRPDIVDMTGLGLMIRVSNERPSKGEGQTDEDGLNAVRKLI